VFCLAFLCLLSVSGHAQSLDRIERERVDQMLQRLKADLEEHYYDPKYHGLDLDARFTAAREKLKQATSLGQALGIAAQTMLDLNDSHTFFLPPSRPGIVDYGWEMQMIGEKCYVVGVRPKSDAEKVGLKPGDLVISVENFKPVRKDLWKMMYYFYALSPRRGLHIVVQSPGGEPRELDVPAKVREGNILDDNLVRKEGPRQHRFYKEGDVAVWKMLSFDLDEPEVDGKVGGIDSSKTLILDLRGNGGGYEITLVQLLGHFFDRKVKVGDIKRRTEVKPLHSNKLGGTPYQGKVIVLIDSESASASELFARTIQIEKRGIVMGDRSSGSVMRSKRHVHELGASSVVFFGASITDADVIMTDGSSLEHIGVIPDELLLPTGEDLAATRDPVLARALELAGLKMSPEKAGALFPIEWKLK
jgi:C-terminal processing protease CtpA/Prc